MDNTIQFTVNELLGFVTTIGGCIVAIETVVIIVFKLVSRVKAPELKQNERLDKLEKADEERKKEIAELSRRLNDGDDKFTEIEKGNKMILRSLQALLRNSLGNGDAEALKDVAKELDEYLLNK